MDQRTNSKYHDANGANKMNYSLERELMELGVIPTTVIEELEMQAVDLHAEAKVRNASLFDDDNNPLF